MIGGHIVNIGVSLNHSNLDEHILNEVNLLHLVDLSSPNVISQPLSQFKGKVIVDGVYRDLNPGSIDLDIQRITKEKVLKSIQDAFNAGASEIIFLSSFLPFVKTHQYEKQWLDQSITFWKDIMSTNPGLRVSICNYFEVDPQILINLVISVNHQQFGLAFDIGHALLYSEVTLNEWFYLLNPYIETVFIHSNDGEHNLYLPIDEGILLQNIGFKMTKQKLSQKNIIFRMNDLTKLKHNIQLLKELIHD